MCGRYLLRNAPEDATHNLWSEYWQQIQLEFEGPRFNISPSQSAWVLLAAEDLRARKLIWGFKPAWSQFNPQINARAESLFTSKMFQHSARNKRCLVLADGFYEPKGAKTQKNRPWYLFEYEDQRSFAMAGIWLDEGFTIITSEPNTQVQPIHDRMPVIMAREHWHTWLNLETDQATLAQLLAPKETPGLNFRPVSDTAKKPSNEGPQCIAPPAGSLF